MCVLEIILQHLIQSFFIILIHDPLRILWSLNFPSLVSQLVHCPFRVNPRSLLIVLVIFLPNFCLPPASSSLIRSLGITVITVLVKWFQ